MPGLHRAALALTCLLFPMSTCAQDVAVGTEDAAVAAAPARIANGTRFGNWVVTCEALAVNETTCVLSQQLARSTDRAFLAELLAFSSADGSRQFMAVRVPLGVYLPSGFVLRPQEATEETGFVWQSCGRDLCEGLLELTGDLAATFDTAETLVGGYRPNRTSEPVVFSLSATGLSEGLAALRGPAAD